MHLSKYLTEVRTEGQVLLFHALNGVLMCLDTPEEVEAYDRFLQTKSVDTLEESFRAALCRFGILQEDSVDETELAKWLFFERYRQSPLLRLLIYVTESCNFRCVYCPQTHNPKTMPLESVEAIAGFVEKELAGRRYKNVYISWFGGEPLLNLPVIERGMHRIQEVCTAHAARLRAGITTNGYLLKQETAARLISLGVTQYQITMDGMPETHDVQRPLAGGGETWSSVWQNLLDMNALPDDFSVSLRINANPSTLPSAKKLIRLACEKLDRRFHLQAQPISNMGNPAPEAQAYYCDMQESMDVRSELTQFACSLRPDFTEPGSLLRPFGLMCSTFDRGYYVISVDGKLLKCELQINDARNQIGSLSDGGGATDEASLAGFVLPDTGERCTNCRLYPMCYGLSCPFRKRVGEHCGFESMDYAVRSQIMTHAASKGLT